jgi:hypothetical protein
MAKSSRRGRAPQVEEEYDDVVEETADSGDKLMTALLVIAFGFIFVGIVLASYTLHQNFDTPFLGVMQKDPAETVAKQAEKDFNVEMGLEGSSSEDEEWEDEGGGEEDVEEEPEEEE